MLRRYIHDSNRVRKDLSERRLQRKFAQYDPDDVLVINMNHKLDELFDKIQERIEENQSWYVIEELYGKEQEEKQE